MPSAAERFSRLRPLPYGLRRSVLKRVAPDMLRDYEFTVRMDGGLKFRGNLVNYIDRVIYFCGAHEKYMLHYLHDTLPAIRRSRPGALTFMDIGANAGNHTLYMAKLVDRVLAFEPFERVRKQLEENIALNKLINVRVYPFGLGDTNARLPFYAGPEDNLGAASFTADHYEGNKLIGEAQIRIGDELAEEESFPRIDILKADIEGFEPQALRGLEETLRRDRPLCIIELSPSTRANLGGAEAMAALFPPDYSFYYFARGKRGNGKYKLAPFDYAMNPKIQDVIAVPNELSS